jgi:L-threonylcarbamoyladenylate synthase
MYNEVTQAAELLKKGKIVAFPTETVYGLGVDYLNENAVSDLFELKGRDAYKPFTLHVSCIKQVEDVASELNDDFYLLAQAFLPGPLTLIVKTAKLFPSMLLKQKKTKDDSLQYDDSVLRTIGIRYPDNVIALELINAFGRPIAATSANYSGYADAINAEEVRKCFSNKIASILDGGETVYKKASTVLSITGPSPVILRQGILEKKHIEDILKKPITVL